MNKYRDTVFPTLPIIFKEEKVLYQPDGDRVIPIVIYFCNIYLIVKFFILI